MDILFYRYNSICEPDLIETFHALGCHTDEIREEMTNKLLSPQEQLSILRKYLESKTYDFVFTINFFPVISEVCNIFKVPYVSWIVDSPVLELYSHSIRNPYNRIFLFDYALYEEFSPENPDGIFYLPLGANVERVDALMDTITPKDHENYSAEVSFIGSLYTEKCPYNQMKHPPERLKGYLDGIIDAQLKVYGYNFLEELITDEILDEFKQHIDFYQLPEKAVHNEKAIMAQLYLGNKVSEQERLRLLDAVSRHFPLDLYTRSDTAMLPEVHNRGGAKTQTEMPKIFHLSKINLNMTTKGIRTGLPLRIWDILAAGGFLITNYQDELPNYFEIGTDLETYSSQEELLEKIDYYLHHDEERKAIAHNGYEKLKAQHTLIHRVKAILSRI